MASRTGTRSRGAQGRTRRRTSRGRASSSSRATRGRSRSSSGRDDPFQALRDDHRRVKRLFKEIEQASARSRRRDLFAELKQELDAHALAEESVLYPRFEETDSTREVVLESYEEHRLVKQLLAECEEIDVTDDRWMAKVTVLKELVEHHADEEEEELFPKAKRDLDAGEGEELAAELEQAKSNFSAS
jgi:hemerythrin superfamily protein